MYTYEAMCIVKPDLTEDDRKTVFSQIAEAITKNKGQVSAAMLWSERKRMTFPIKKQQEGAYHLVTFTAPPAAVAELHAAYRLNENILRVLITRIA